MLDDEVVLRDAAARASSPARQVLRLPAEGSQNVLKPACPRARTLVRARARDYLWIRMRQPRSSRSPDAHFENWVVKRFGRTLYDLFFGTYTSKAWGMPCTRDQRRLGRPAHQPGEPLGHDQEDDQPAREGEVRSLVHRVLVPGEHGGIGQIGAQVRREDPRAWGGDDSPATLRWRASRSRAAFRDARAPVNTSRPRGGRSSATSVVNTIPLPRLLEACPGRPIGEALSETRRADREAAVHRHRIRVPRGRARPACPRTTGSTCPRRS